MTYEFLDITNLNNCYTPYILEQLKYGNLLSNNLLKLKHKLFFKKVNIIAPNQQFKLSNFNSPDIFKNGGVFSPPNYVDRFLASYLQDLNFETKYLIIEDPILKPNDSVLKKEKLKYLTVKGSIYHFTNLTYSTKEQIESTIKSAQPYPFIAMIVAADKSIPVIDSKNAEIIFNEVELIKIIILDIFDNESYLIVEI